jgi:predicted unusual protein kinase regulating ubiquinone biosynthesis (AarF/ABC1/UbiB family)
VLDSALDSCSYANVFLSKIGQVMSSRSDFLPYQYINKFSSLQDSIPQWPVEEAIQVVRESLRNERGLEFEEVFESIDPVALGCASIGQVHRATLKEKWLEGWDGEKVVALKIMHPSAKEKFRCDFQVFHWLCRIALPGWQGMLEELERRLMTEFDYRNEANNQVTIRKSIENSPYKNKVKVPHTYSSLTCQHVLVMEMLEGKKLIDSIQDKLSQLLGGDEEKAASFLAERKRGKPSCYCCHFTSSYTEHLCTL